MGCRTCFSAIGVKTKGQEGYSVSSSDTCCGSRRIVDDVMAIRGVGSPLSTFERIPTTNRSSLCAFSCPSTIRHFSRRDIIRIFVALCYTNKLVGNMPSLPSLLNPVKQFGLSNPKSYLKGKLSFACRVLPSCLSSPVLPQACATLCEGSTYFGTEFGSQVSECDTLFRSARRHGFVQQKQSVMHLAVVCM